MADNYIERRMEELRSGRLGIKKAIPGIRPKARRVVVAGGCHGPAREKVIEFRKAGCRVAVFDADGQAGRTMAHDHGIRFHRVDIEDESAVSNEMLSLLSAWQGVDVIAGSTKHCDIMKASVNNWKKSLPMTDKSHFDIVIIDEIPHHDNP